MAHFDSTSMWGGDDNKANAGIELDWENARLTVAAGGEITNSNRDFTMDDDGIELTRGGTGKTGFHLGSALTMGLYNPGEYAGLIGAYNDGGTPTIDEATLWIVGGYRESNDDGIGSIILEGDTIHAEGEFSATTKLFRIPHPNPEMTDSKDLCHSAVESPTAGDNLYRDTIEAEEDNQIVVHEMPAYFKHLNKNPQAWITAQSSNDVAYDIEFSGNEITFTCPKAGVYNMLIIGTRKDEKATEHWKGAVRSNSQNQ